MRKTLKLQGTEDENQISLTVQYLKPSVETMAAMDPTVMAPHGLISRSADVPTATPPARVAFWMATYENKIKINKMKLSNLDFGKIVIAS